jgi:hypothetical protein
LFEDLHVIADELGKDGPNFEEGGGHVLREGAARKLLDKKTAEGECARFVGREGDGLEMEAFEDGIADTALRGEGDTGVAEGGEIAIGGADGDIEFAGDILGTRDAAGLEVKENGEEAVETIHGARKV